MGCPSLSERQPGGDIAQIEERSRKGDDRYLRNIPEGFRAHCLNPEEDDCLAKHRAYYDPDIEVFFFEKSGGCCCNLVPKEEISGSYDKIFKAVRLAEA